MRQFLFRLGLAIVSIAFSATSLGAAQAKTPPAAASIEGTWAGKVSADSGEMKVRVVIKIEQGKASGSIETAHGSWQISGGTFKDGVWTLPFTVEGAGDRWMKGQIKGDDFSGEWNNAPMAVGTFALKREK
jgi:hypothetical protein